MRVPLGCSFHPASRRQSETRALPALSFPTSCLCAAHPDRSPPASDAHEHHALFGAVCLAQSSTAQRKTGQQAITIATRDSGIVQSTSHAGSSCVLPPFVFDPICTTLTVAKTIQIRPIPKRILTPTFCICGSTRHLLPINPAPARTDAADDDRVSKFVDTLFKRTAAEAGDRGLTSQYIYMNYASKY